MNDSCDERGRLAARANPHQDSPDGRGTSKLRSCNDGLRMISVGAMSDSSHVDSPRGPRTVVCLGPNIFASRETIAVRHARSLAVPIERQDLQ